MHYGKTLPGQFLFLLCLLFFKNLTQTTSIYFVDAHITAYYKCSKIDTRLCKRFFMKDIANILLIAMYPSICFTREIPVTASQ